MAAGRRNLSSAACQRFSSDKLTHAGMPLLTDPVVMNQKSFPSGADCVGFVETAGMLPVP
jgi:hypothetical protein